MIDVSEQLRRHIDEYCGSSPSALLVEEGLGIRVATFEDTPTPGLVTSITIGLSGHVFDQRSGKKLRQELMTCVDRRYQDLPWGEVLLSAGKIALSRHTAFMLGEVIGPAGPLFPEAPWCKATALLCSLPAFFDPEFAEIDLGDSPMVFVELIPITSAEAEWVQHHGWSAFFDRVNRGEIDILNLSRP
jgi:hypothetical protein